MGHPRISINSSTTTGEFDSAAGQDGTLLAAAVAAALVEYRRYSEQRNQHHSLGGAVPQWRLLGRLEQLRR